MATVLYVMFPIVPQKFRKISRDIYGHNFKAWVVFQRVEIQLSFSKIQESIYGMLNEKVEHLVKLK